MNPIRKRPPSVDELTWINQGIRSVVVAAATLPPGESFLDLPDRARRSMMPDQQHNLLMNTLAPVAASGITYILHSQISM